MSGVLVHRRSKRSKRKNRGLSTEAALLERKKQFAILYHKTPQSEIKSVKKSLVKSVHAPKIATSCYPKTKLTSPVYSIRKKILSNKQSGLRRLSEASKQLLQSQPESTRVALIYKPVMKTASKLCLGNGRSLNLTNDNKRMTRSSFESEHFAPPSGKIKPKKAEQKLTKTLKVMLSSVSTSNSDMTAMFTSAEVRQNVIKDSKRVTRSSFGSVSDSSSLKNTSKKSKLLASPLSPSLVKNIAFKQDEKEKVPSIITKDSKRMTRSSFGEVSDSTLLKNTSPNSELVTAPSSLLRAAEKEVRSKRPVAGIKPDTVPKFANRVTRSSIESVFKSTLLKNMNPNSKLSTSPVHRSVEKRVKSKQPAQENELNTAKVFKRVTRSSMKETIVTSSLESDNKKMKEGEFQKRKMSNNSKKEKGKKSMSRRRSVPNLGTKESGNHLHNDTKAPKDSKISKGIKRKILPRADKRNGQTAPITPVATENCTYTEDCLTVNFPNKRPRRHTAPMPDKSKSPSVTQKKREKSAKLKTKSIKLAKDKNNTPSLPAKLKPPKSKNSVSSVISTPDNSQLPIDDLSTFISVENVGTKRPQSAPAAIKKSVPVKSGKGMKLSLPTKGTLKRKRWMFNALKEKNEGYEDDIFENQKFSTPPLRMSREQDDESDSSISTPKFGFFLTPALPKKTPRYKEIISPSELLLARKRAEEYLFRRNKQRISANNSRTSITSLQTSMTKVSSDLPEKKKLEFAEVMDKLAIIQKDFENKNQDESGEEDAYFSDVSI